MKKILNTIALYIYYYLWKITKLEYFLTKYSVTIVRRVRMEAKNKYYKPKQKKRFSKLDCLYNFNNYGGEQCWNCPIRVDCIERSSRKEIK